MKKLFYNVPLSEEISTFFILNLARMAAKPAGGRSGVFLKHSEEEEKIVAAADRCNFLQTLLRSDEHASRIGDPAHAEILFRREAAAQTFYAAHSDRFRHSSSVQYCDVLRLRFREFRMARLRPLSAEGFTFPTETASCSRLQGGHSRNA